MDWRLIVTGLPLRGAENMAVDHALHRSVQAGGRPALRFYRWARPCLSFGRNQAVQGAFDPVAARRLGVDVVRRPTGGMAVLHDREATYAVAAPVGQIGSPRETYVAVNRCLVAGLRRLGVAAASAPAGRPVPRAAAGRGAVCFEAAAPGEVVARGRKLIGSAQRCERRTLLQHGSLLLDGDQAGVSELLPGPTGPAPATLASLLPCLPAWDDLVAALAAGFRDALGIRLAPDDLSGSERVSIRDLTRTYRSAAWTWRR